MSESLIALELVMHVRCIVAERLLHVGDNRQRLILHFNLLRRVPRHIQIFSHHHCHRLANVTNAPFGKHWMTRHLQPRHRNRAWNRADAGRILRGKNPNHPGRALRRIRIDGLDVGMSMWRPGKRAIHHPRELEIVGVVADPTNEPRIFFALQPPAYPCAFAVCLTRSGWSFCWSRHWSPRSCARRNRFGHLARSILHRGYDVLIPGAAADIAIKRFANLAIARVGIVPQQIMRAHNHAGSTEAALQAVLLPESLLNRMQLVTTGQTFYRCDLATICLNRQYGTGLHRPAIHQHRARATQRSLTTDMRTGESRIFAQEMDEQQPRLNRSAALRSIYGDCNIPRHRVPAGIAGLGRKIEAAHDNKRQARITSSREPGARYQCWKRCPF